MEDGRIDNAFLKKYGETLLAGNSSNTRSSPIQVGALATWSKISESTTHTTAIKTDGTLWAWGANDSGQIGDNTQGINRSSPIQIGTLATWSSVAAGSAHTLAIDTAGKIWAWGKNSVSFQLGLNDAVDRSSPTQIGTLTTWSSVSAGRLHSAAVDTAGKLWTWGNNANTNGALGDNTAANKSSPVQIGTLTTWSSVSAGGNQTGAVKTDGTLWAWGLGTSGQLGDNTAATKSSPVQIGTLTTWSFVNVGLSHSAVINTDGTLWAWGLGTTGQLGDNTAATKSSPVQIGTLTTWSKIAVGYTHTTAVKTDNTLWAWGVNNAGQVGDNTGTTRSSPVQIGTMAIWQTTAGMLAAGASTTAAIDNTGAGGTSGKLWEWGLNNAGQLGDDTFSATNGTFIVDLARGNVFNCSMMANTSFSFINAVASGPECSFTLILTQDSTGSRTAVWPANVLWDNGSAPVPTGTAGRISIFSFTSPNGGKKWFGSLLERDFYGDASPTTFTWGSNAAGELGLKDAVPRAAPAPQGASSWSVITSGVSHISAIKSDGTLWGWGNNSSGAFGNNTATAQSSPVQIGTLATWSSVKGATFFSGAIKTDNTLWGWGINTSGSLGDNTATTRSSPVQIGTLATWSKVAAFGQSMAAIKTDNTLWAWGLGTSGQIGDDTAATKSSPVQIGTLATWSALAVHGPGSSNMTAIKADGTLWAWGLGSGGRVGDNAATTRSSPVQIGTLATWSVTAHGNGHTLAVKTDGTLWAWGVNTNGVVGDNTATTRSSPVQIGTLSTWSTISTGGYSFSMAIKTDGTLWGWGLNGSGQVGNNTLITQSSPVQIGVGITTWTQVAGGRSHTIAIKT